MPSFYLSTASQIPQVCTKNRFPHSKSELLRLVVQIRKLIIQEIIHNLHEFFEKEKNEVFKKSLKITEEAGLSGGEGRRRGYS